MNRFYPLAFSLLILNALSSNAQITISNVAEPQPGDSVVTFIDANPDIEVAAPGGDQSWQWMLDNSVSQVVRFDTNDRPDLFQFADIRSVQAGFDNYYTIEDNTWYLHGQHGEDPFGVGLMVSTFFLPPERVQYAPLAYEDKVEQIFDAYAGIPLSIIPDSILSTLPLVPDSMRARIATFTVDDVDAWGDLIINQGIESVLRVRQERRISIRVEAKISILPWTDVTDLLSSYLDALPFEVDLVDTITTYRFMAPGYLLPVAVVTEDSTGGAGSVVYQQPIQSSTEFARDIRSIPVFPNPASAALSVDIGEIENVGAVKVFDGSGRMIYRVALEGLSQVIRIPLDAAGSGVHLVSVWDDKGTLVALQKVQVVK